MISHGLRNCIQCGYCLEACPTYRETCEESLSPRGRVALLRCLTGSPPFSENAVTADPAACDPQLARALDLCLVCGACQPACPSGVVVPQLLSSARDGLAGAHRRGRRARIVLSGLLGLLHHRRLLSLALRSVRLACRLRIARMLVRLFTPRAHRAHFLDLAASLEHPASQWRPAISGGARAKTADTGGLGAAEGTIPGGARAKTTDTGGSGAAEGTTTVGRRHGGEAVFVFRGCVTPVLFPDVLSALESVLSRLGDAVHSPAGQTCCGALHIHFGDLDGARRLARRNIRVFEEAGEGPIVAESAGCGAALKSYGELLAGDPEFADRARRFAARVQDVSERLADSASMPTAGAAVGDAMRPGRESAPQGSEDSDRLRVVLQSPCHLRNLQGLERAPGAILDALPRIERVAADEEDLCCGAAGIYNLLQPDMAARLGERKATALAASGAEIAVTSDPGCRLQLAGRLRRRGLQCVHLVELADELRP
ncbi:MAG: (Fe-S)-binding protein [Candidatus Eisenbacteria sp.]|nr:(Fe-S)-binding protein [Candidatus Eisenbacteria bacterium]